MPDNIAREDLRIQKTNNMLMAALSSLLKRQNFSRITVNDLCEEALVSRSTFYSHFKDKYDLLRYWLADVESQISFMEYTYEHIEKTINDFASDNKKTIKNLVESANSETSELLCNFVLSLLDIEIDEVDKGNINLKDTVLLTVCCGGILNYLLWQVNNKLPADYPVMNPYIYEILIHCQKWGGGWKYCKEAPLPKRWTTVGEGKE